MEYRHAELDVGIVPNTINCRLAASLTKCAFVGRTQTTIEDSILHRQTVGRRVEISVSDLEFRDFDCVLGIEKTELELFAISSESREFRYSENVLA